MAVQMGRSRPPRARGSRPERVAMVRGGPDGRKYEKETADITRRIKELESKLKPVSSNATQVIMTELNKETAALAELEKTKESTTAEMKATDTKIREIGVKYKEKKFVANDLLVGVRHKSDSRHKEAMERLEQQIVIRRSSSTEERKFRQEIDALKKSKERLAEYNAVKSEVDQLKEEQEALRAQRDALHKKTKELRGKELSTKDVISNLKQEFEEAKERKKVGVTERDELTREIDRLHIERRQLYDRFRAEQLAFNEQLRQQSEEERQRRDENRAAREARRKFNKFRDLGRNFQREQQLLERLTTCKALISHLNKLTLNPATATSSHAAAGGPAAPDLDEDSSPVGSVMNLDPSPPRRSESDPVHAEKPGEYILKHREEEVLVPASRVGLTRKKSKKDKRKAVPVVKRLNLNHTVFSQFAALDLAPPNTFSDIPHTLSLLQDKLTYLEGMTKRSFWEMELADSGVVSTTPSELNYPMDQEGDFAANSQEEDPGIGSTVSPKRTHSADVGNGSAVSYSKLLSSTKSPLGDHVMHAGMPTTTKASVSGEWAAMCEGLSLMGVNGENVHDQRPNLVSTVSSSTAGASGASIAAVTGSEE